MTTKMRCCKLKSLFAGLVLEREEGRRRWAIQDEHFGCTLCAVRFRALPFRRAWRVTLNPNFVEKKHNSATV